MFRSFKLIVLIFISSYMIGIFWFIMCNFNKTISNTAAMKTFVKEVIVPELSEMGFGMAGKAPPVNNI